MYSVNIILIYPVVYLDDDYRFVGTIEDAINRCVERSVFKCRTHSHNITENLTIYNFDTKYHQDDIKKRLLEKLSVCGFEETRVYVESKKINRLEEHAKLIAVALASVGALGTVFGGISLLTHPLSP